MSEMTYPDAAAMAAWEIHDLLRRLRDAGLPLAFCLQQRPSWIGEEPEPDDEGRLWARRRRGPQMRLEITLTDESRAADLPLASYAHDYGLARRIDTAALTTTVVWT